ncbi:lytic transglycosylase domain-containing protein [Mesorhizobium sp.]|uniref:lytic transglycosylase domain-containing protein n=1 Tax=Mesorhizobium sp. TaxID=1871066 RepID=UPI000FEAA86E|nr:lytic transglycosylase domain-containing protein [Mesorhizobium sp.]RWA67992.1 MAG: lytic transglycosylase domain-containing protein [Mesorhizobium sp.]
MIRRFPILFSLLWSPALADVATIDGTVLDPRQQRDKTTTDLDRVDRHRYGKSQGITCALYRPGRKDDPVAAASANPTIAGLVRRIAREEGIDENHFLALVYQESRFNPCAKSGAGALGLSQLMPGTAGDLGVNPYDIEQNLRGGARYFKQQLRLFNGNVALALAAYNAGAGNVQKYGGIPPFRETQGYVASITQKWLPAFGGSDKSAIPLSYGGGTAVFEGARHSTLNAMGLTAAMADGSGDVRSWLEQLGAVTTGTVQDSWDQNSGVRNANIEMLNRLILLGTAFADLTNSRNALSLSDISGSSRSGGYGGASRPPGKDCARNAGAARTTTERPCTPGSDSETALQLTPQ